MIPTRLAEFGPLSKAEERVVAGLRSGALDRLGDGSRPSADDPTRVLRADLVRFLILGGDEDSRPHEKGLRISGAFIQGVLDLEGCRVPRDIGLKDCLFDRAPTLRSAVIDSLFMDGSAFPGLEADRLEARGGVYLRSAAILGEVELRGARLGGHFDCRGATIENPGGMAISADGLELRGSVLLRGTTIVGGIGLPAARLGGDLDCVGVSIERPGEIALDGDNIEMRGDFALRSASIAGGIRAQGARIGGDVDCSTASLSQPGGYALRMNRTVIQERFLSAQGGRDSRRAGPDNRIHRRRRGRPGKLAAERGLALQSLPVWGLHRRVGQFREPAGLARPRQTSGKVGRGFLAAALRASCHGLPPNGP